MNISVNSANLLKFVVSYTGQKELNPEGQEVLSLRRLNGDESSQRRFFVKALEELLKPSQTQITEMKTKFDEFIQERRTAVQEAAPKAEDESDDAFNTRVALALNQDAALKAEVLIYRASQVAVGVQKIEVAVAEKTKDFLKKYFVLYGNEVGYFSDDDESVDELNGVFGL